MWMCLLHKQDSWKYKMPKIWYIWITKLNCRKQKTVYSCMLTHPIATINDNYSMDTNTKLNNHINYALPYIFHVHTLHVFSWQMGSTDNKFSYKFTVTLTVYVKVYNFYRTIGLVSFYIQPDHTKFYQTGVFWYRYKFEFFTRQPVLCVDFFHQPDSNFTSKNWRSGNFRILCLNLVMNLGLYK